MDRLIEECCIAVPKPVATPSAKGTFSEFEEDAKLQEQLHKALRGAAARTNYVASDRIDAQYACKQVCRDMSTPAMHAFKSRKRLCTNFLGAPRLVYEFPRQVINYIDVLVGMILAGCPRTRTSTSGEVVMLCRHLMKQSSSTQASTVLSSGETTFAGVIKGDRQGLGFQSLLKNVGVALPLRVWSGSTAAVGICTRQGLGTLRHLNCNTLWIQQAVRTGRIEPNKIAGHSNLTASVTKHLATKQNLLDLAEIFFATRFTTTPYVILQLQHNHN